MERIVRYFLSCLVFLLISCASLKGKVPCELEGELKVISGRNAVAFKLENLSGKTIEKVTFVLGVYDMDGEPVFDSDWINFEMKLCILPGECVEDYYVLDDSEAFFDSNCQLDYFYVSKALFEDGTCFEDPFGRFVK